MNTIIILSITLAVTMFYNSIKKRCPKLDNIIENNTPSWNIRFDII